MLRATTPVSALLRARLANAVTCALLLLLAVWALAVACAVALPLCMACVAAKGHRAPSDS
jgi:hypothetical protein